MATDGTEGQMGGVPLTMGDDEVEYVPEFPALKAQDMSVRQLVFDLCCWGGVAVLVYIALAC